MGNSHTAIIWSLIATCLIGANSNTTTQGFQFINSNEARTDFSDTDLQYVLPSPTPYLIIYADAFSDQRYGYAILEQFAEWKRGLGFDVEMVKLSTTGANINDNNPDTQAVHNYIRNWWNQKDAVFSYVLLVGDAPPYNEVEGPGDDFTHVTCADPNRIPTGTYCSGGVLTFPSDYVYQLLDGDLKPDVALGRWCACPAPYPLVMDLGTYVYKTISYENPELQYNWQCARALFACYEESANVNPEKSPFRQVKLSCEDTLRKYNSDYASRTLECWGADSRNQDIKDKLSLNGGVGLLNYAGHGNCDSWPEWNFYVYHTGPNGEQYRESFTADTSVRTLENAAFYPVIFQIGCLTGNIAAPADYYHPEPGYIDEELESMVEAWTRYPLGGGVAAFGSSVGVGGGNLEYLDAAIFHALFADNLNCGSSIKQAKSWLVDNLGDDGVFQAHAYYWIGDPSLDVWRQQPHQATITGQITIDGRYLMTVLRSSDNAPIQGAKVCMYCPGVCQLVGYTDIAGQVYFPWYPNPGTYHFIATNQKGPICIKPAYVSYTQNGGLFSWSGTEDTQVISGWELASISPNPLSAKTTISYSVGCENEVNLKVYDATGREVRNLVSVKQAPGHYEITWDGRDGSGAELASGVYFVRMEAKNFSVNKKITLVR